MQVNKMICKKFSELFYGEEGQGHKDPPPREQKGKEHDFNIHSQYYTK